MSTTSSPPVVSTPNRRNTNPPSYSDVEKEKTHKVNKFYALVSNADNSKEILTAFIAKVSKKGSKGRKEKEPVGSPTQSSMNTPSLRSIQQSTLTVESHNAAEFASVVYEAIEAKPYATQIVQLQKRIQTLEEKVEEEKRRGAAAVKGEKARGEAAVQAEKERSEGALAQAAEKLKEEREWWKRKRDGGEKCNEITLEPPKKGEKILLRIRPRGK